jgi:hypothetical protein
METIDNQQQQTKIRQSAADIKETSNTNQVEAMQAHTKVVSDGSQSLKADTSQHASADSNTPPTEEFESPAIRGI